MTNRLAMSFGVALGLAALASCGCGGAGGDRPEMARVDGTITYNGEPVTTGTVTLIPVEGEKGGESDLPAIGEIDTDGSFELTTFDTGDGAVLGQHKVIVVAKPKPEGTPENDLFMGGVIPSQLPEDIAKRAEESKPLVPEKYSDPEKTPLRYTVKPDGNQFDIVLKD